MTRLVPTKCSCICSSGSCSASLLGRGQLMGVVSRDGDFLGPCAQVQGRGPCPQGHGSDNSVHALALIDKDIRHTSRPHNHHHQAFDSGVAFLCSPNLNISGQPVAEHAGSDVGSARRRRERRLRSLWRHERMTVAAELAVALHHSRGVGPAVPHEALRGQTPASSRGRRPGVLKELEPPVVVEHAACPCSGAPLLARAVARSCRV